MSSLAELPELVGFFSYSRDDDEAFKGTLSALRDAIQRELSAQLGRSRKTFRLWQDQAAIAPGELWEKEIREAVDQSYFFIPIVTPRSINSKYCKFEFELFLAREKTLGRDNLVFPILYISVAALEDEAKWRNNPVLSTIGQRQYVDWRPLRHLDIETSKVREHIERFCQKIVEALNEPWTSPEERRRMEEERLEVEAKRRAAEEESRKRAEAEARQRAEEEARRLEAEAKRRADEEEQRQRKAKARQQVDQEEAQRLEAEAKRKAEEEEVRKRAEAEARRRAEEQRAEVEHRAEEERKRAESEATDARRKRLQETGAEIPTLGEAPVVQKLRKRKVALAIGIPLLVAVALAAAVIISGKPSNTTATSTSSLQEQAKSRWLDVQNQYRRRADLVPNLVAIVQGYIAQEKSVLTAVVDARAKATQITVNSSDLTDPVKLRAFQDAQAQLTGALGRLLAVSENYPRLKSDANFLALQSQLEGTENRISVARRDYNDVVRAYNTALRTSAFSSEKPMTELTGG